MSLFLLTGVALNIVIHQTHKQPVFDKKTGCFSMLFDKLITGLAVISMDIIALSCNRKSRFLLSITLIFLTAAASQVISN